MCSFCCDITCIACEDAQHDFDSACHFSSNNYPLSEAPLNLSWQLAKPPMGKANCRRTKALGLYLINTSNEILISIRHGTTLSTLSGFSQEENDLLSLLKGMLKLCVCGAIWHITCVRPAVIMQKSKSL